MFKIIGCICVWVCCGYIGFYFASKLKTRVRILTAQKIMLQKISTYLSYNKTPTKELIHALSVDKELEALTYLKRCDELLTKGKDFPVAMNTSIDEMSELTKEDKPVLQSLSSILGSFDVNSQLSAIAMQQHLLESTLENARQSSKQKGRLYRSLGLLCGLALAIMMF